MKTPEWLRERTNDPCGTPNRHPFWESVNVQVVGVWKIFERDGAWFGYKTTQNCWTTPRPSRADVMAMATGPQVDVWA
jgi:hypothetical protein